jgi:hypothetical protein
MSKARATQDEYTYEADHCYRDGQLDHLMLEVHEDAVVPHSGDHLDHVSR